MNIQQLFGIELPIVQAPMAGVQTGVMAVAVSNAGGLGSLPCAMLTPDGLRNELQLITAQTSRPYNLNFFCHVPPTPDAAREAKWRAALAPYYAELGIDASSVPAGGGRARAGGGRGGAAGGRHAGAGGGADPARLRRAVR